MFIYIKSIIHAFNINSFLPFNMLLTFFYLNITQFMLIAYKWALKSIKTGRKRLNILKQTTIMGLTNSVLNEFPLYNKNKHNSLRNNLMQWSDFNHVICKHIIKNNT